ncbi:diguanylate cyclase [Candidatus Albibeggiatoa sp. nov. NOAA]|uniref:GGDEF domain-containing protein n=1 Tax=Candidatus Albibeggiatoa sp. nov. NOAA TaxID=3162724 RepID=UPI0032FA88AB|nr:diguanylate cyclase [Thiotrichaceae bacterium]
MFKVILVVLFASLLPLLAMFAYFMLLGQSTASLFIPLVLSVISVSVNILLLYLLLKPILFTSKQLDGYINNEVPLHLPAGHKDEVGVLMEHVQYITQKLEFMTRSQSKDTNLDPLTNVLNRQAGEERLRQDIARASRDNSRLLVVLLDIDNFSQINESFGRHIGDVCLTHVAQVTLNNIRKGDWIARWGGDRFLMVLWNFNNGEPRIVLERIKKQSIHTPMNELLKLDLSIGACDYQNEVDVDILLGKLNECMYQAKQSGSGGIEICPKS